MQRVDGTRAIYMADAAVLVVGHDHAAVPAGGHAQRLAKARFVRCTVKIAPAGAVAQQQADFFRAVSGWRGGFITAAAACQQYHGTGHDEAETRSEERYAK